MLGHVRVVQLAGHRRHDHHTAPQRKSTAAHPGRIIPVSTLLNAAPGEPSMADRLRAATPRTAASPATVRRHALDVKTSTTFRFPACVPALPTGRSLGRRCSGGPISVCTAGAKSTASNWLQRDHVVLWGKHENLLAPQGRSAMIPRTTGSAAHVASRAADASRPWSPIPAAACDEEHRCVLGFCSANARRCRIRRMSWVRIRTSSGLPSARPRGVQ